MSQIRKKLQRGLASVLKAIERVNNRSSDREDEMLSEALLANTLLESFVDDIVNRAETFDFGTLNFKQVEDESGVAADFYRAGFMIPPFDNFVFQFRMDYGEDDPISPIPYQGSNLTIIGTTNREIISEVLDASNVSDDPNDFRFIIFGMLATGSGDLIVAGAVGFVDPDRRDANLGFCHLLGMASVNWWVARFHGACWSILNTKGIELKRRGPTKEQHAALLAKGNTTGRPITYVGVKKYLEAREEAARMASSGTHASPRPHLRRGHIRQWRGRPVAVRPCIVNSTVGDVIKRDTYVVKHQGGHL